MAQIALYRAWRPLDFDAVVAQQQIVQTLKQAVKNAEVGHAYLFCGTRGTGKTSLAKILARAVNCLNQRDGNPCNQCEICLGILDNTLLDVQEIDAASNNSVENVRRIIDEIVFLPVLAKYKVYIIDEVHMLSPGAFNALLKTLEEPPTHAIFILATTEPHRIPATILSRCQRFDFRRIPDTKIVERLRMIAAEEKISIDDEALEQIAILGDGALRDAVSLLDQSRLSFPEGISADKVRSLVGSVNKLFYADLATSLWTKRVDDVLIKVATLITEGRDLARFTAELASFYRDILVAKAAPNSPQLISGSHEEKLRIQNLSKQLHQEYLNFAIMELSALMQELRWAEQARTSLEICLLKIVAQGSKQPMQSAQTAQPTQTAQAAEVADTAIETEAKPKTMETAPINTESKTASPVPLEAKAAQEVADFAPEPEPEPVPEFEAPPELQFELEFEPEAELEPEPEAEATFREEVLPDPPLEAGLNEAEAETEIETESAATEDAEAPFNPGDHPAQNSFFDLFSAEDLALLSPETLAAAQTDDRDSKLKSSAPTSARLEDGGFAPEILKQYWKETLDTLSVEEAFLFLFAREAVPKPVKTALELHFAEKTRHHYNVLSSAQGHDVFLTWDKTCYPDTIPLKLVANFSLEEEAPAQQADDDWMLRIRKAAEELNVPFEDELE